MLKELLIKEDLFDLIDSVKEKWLLRMQCERFIILVNKNTGEYVNWYAEDFNNPNALKIISSVLDKHKNYK